MGVRHHILFGLVGLSAGLLALAAPARAGEPISIVVQEMPGLIEPGKALPYKQLLDALLEDAPVANTVTILPGYRGPRLWLRREYQCIFGGVSAPGHARPRDTAISPTDWSSLHISAPFNVLEVHAFTRGNEAPARSFTDLQGQKIAVDQVLFFDLRFHSDALKASDFVKVGTAEEALGLLSDGRVNHVFAYDNDVALLQDKTHALFAYDASFTLLELEESMMCWSGGDVAELVGHINGRLAELKETGTLESLLPKLR